jgi:hypothetical protein
MAALILAACGGGGTERNPNLGGPISVAPTAGTFYAGQASTITLSGGRPPYSITSGEPGILPVPPIVNGNSFQVIPNNPGVVDTGLQPGQVPVRTVNITIRDSTGITADAVIKVAQNFLTGYFMSFGASTCPANAPCRGGETAVIFDTTTNGTLFPGKVYRLTHIRGPFQFVDPLNSNNLKDIVDIAADHEGKVVAVIRATGGIPSEISILTVTDVVTGATTERVFVISATTATTSLTLIPTTINLAGASPGQCGSGTSDVLVLDGKPPYVTFSSSSSVFVTPVDPNNNPGRFRVTVVNGGTCLTAEPVIFQDSTGARATLTITTTKGAAAPPPPPLAIAPATMTLSCGGSGTITAVGGSGTYSATSNHPRVTAIVSGNSITVTRLGPVPPDPAPPYPATATITVTDGATFQTSTVTVPVSCP